MDIFSFENLNAFQISRELVREVYSLVKTFPVHENYALGQQLRRAIISVPSNIAECCGRQSFKDKKRFLEIAYGSLTESYCQLLIAKDLQYLSDDALERLKPIFTQTSRLIAGLSKSYQNKIDNKSN